ncbi:hypothetical protein LguiA_021228 [Lonicera macranthoides]
MIKCKANSAKRRDANLNVLGSLQNNHPGINQAGVYSFSNLLGVENIGSTALPFYDYCPPVVSDSKQNCSSCLSSPFEMEAYKNDEGLISMFRHFGVSQLAVKYFPRQKPLDDITRPPLRSSYDFKVPKTFLRLYTSVILYNDLVHVEACLYGSVYERG